MTGTNGSVWDKYQKLERCYDRLAEALADEDTEPRIILELAAETEQLIAALAAGAQPEGAAGEILARLTLLQKKAAGLTVRLQKEREKAAELLSEVKKGRKALSAYVFSSQEMEYKEGKFVDRKK